MVSAWASSGPSGSAKGYFTPLSLSVVASAASSSQVVGGVMPALVKRVLL